MSDNQITFVNNTPGYYWVQQHKGEDQLTIARLTKHSGWEYLASRHSNKMIRIAPHRVVKKIQSDDDETIVVPNQICQMIEFRRASFEYAVIANLLEQNDLPKDKLVQYLREQSKRFTIAHDRAQSEYAASKRRNT